MSGVQEFLTWIQWIGIIELTVLGMFTEMHVQEVRAFCLTCYSTDPFSLLQAFSYIQAADVMSASASVVVT